MKILDTNIKWLIFLPGILVVLIRCIDIISPLSEMPDYSKEVKSDDNRVLHAFLSRDQKWRLPLNHEDINPALEKTFLFKEDRWFYMHPGINPFAIFRAGFNNMVKGRRTSGASTITMQVARMLNRQPRTYLNKIMEMMRAVQLEFHYSKKEILIMYLNLLPYGGNIEGVRTASLIWFEQQPVNLSLSQITHLTLVPNNPNLLNPLNNFSGLRSKRDIWLRKFENAGLFAREIITDALSENEPAQFHPLPRLAPHISLHLRNKCPDLQTIHTSLDHRTQKKAEELTGKYVRRYINSGITNAAVVVVNVTTNQVKAYVGSADFHHVFHQGQVDGVRAIRSPGSALKPFLYGLAFDLGVCTPKSTVTDIPYNFDGYEPDNYDGDYRGTTTVEDALALSLNIPAVKLLSETGLDKFTELLARGGLGWISENRQKMGLSLILGGCGVNLLQLCGLYTCLANQGVYRPITMTVNPSVPISDTLFSRESAYMITEILTNLKRPDLPDEFTDRTDIPKIAWKTGTSYGRRDAWAIGYNSKYCVGVWLGNFNNKGAPGLSGSDIAVPLLFDIFRIINPSSGDHWFIPPETLTTRIVCNKSGLPPDTCCHDLTLDYYIPGISKSRICSHLKAVYADPKEKMSYCRNCLPESGYKIKLYPNPDPGLSLFYESENIASDKIPPHNPGCERLGEGTSPVIATLTNGAGYLLINPGQQLSLQAWCAPGTATVYWFINRRFYMSAPVNKKVFFTPEIGKNAISCADDQGRKTSIRITVEKGY